MKVTGECLYGHCHCDIRDYGPTVTQALSAPTSLGTDAPRLQRRPRPLHSESPSVVARPIERGEARVS